MKYLLISLFSLLLLTTSCQKNSNDGPMVVAGTIVENGSMKPIAGADVWITAQDRHSGWSGGLGGGPAGARYQKSDTNGHFSFSFYENNDSVYGIWVRANPKLYFEGPVGEDGNLYNGQDTKNRMVRIDAKGWIRFHVINEPPLDTVNELHIQGAFNPSITFETLNKDTTSIGVGIANKKALIWTHIERDLSTIVDIKDTISIISHDTIIYSVNY